MTEPHEIARRRFVDDQNRAPCTPANDIMIYATKTLVLTLAAGATTITQAQQTCENIKDAFQTNQCARTTAQSST